MSTSRRGPKPTVNPTVGNESDYSAVLRGPRYRWVETHAEALADAVRTLTLEEQFNFAAQLVEDVCNEHAGDPALADTAEAWALWTAMGAFDRRDLRRAYEEVCGDGFEWPDPEAARSVG